VQKYLIPKPMAMPAEVYFYWKIKSGVKPPCRTYSYGYGYSCIFELILKMCIYNLELTVEISIYKHCGEKM
jgi:hypothetical protein